MGDLAEFKKRILIRCLILAAAGVIVSLAILGPDLRFLLGILCGTAAIMVGLAAMVWSGKALLIANQRWPLVGGYFLRLLVYGVIFYLCLRWGGYRAAAGCGAGFLTLPVAILILYGIENNLPGARKRQPERGSEPGKWRDPAEWEDPAEEDDYRDL